MTMEPMRSIFKYALRMGRDVYQLPKDAELLSVQFQGETITLWALVDENAPLVGRRILVVYTGTCFDGDADQYVGTVQLADMVYHVFDYGECPGTCLTAENVPG